MVTAFTRLLRSLSAGRVRAEKSAFTSKSNQVKNLGPQGKDQTLILKPDSEVNSKENFYKNHENTRFHEKRDRRDKIDRDHNFGIQGKEFGSI